MQTIPGKAAAEAAARSPRTLHRRRFVGSTIVAATLLVAACASATPNPATPVATAAATSPPPVLPTAAPTAATAPTGTTMAAATVATATGPAAFATTTPTGPAAVSLTPTNANVDPEEPTLAVTEGPYFKANSPERTALVDASVVGTKLALTGQVLSTHGKPLAKALLDFWQADGRGNYDNAGYILRGHQFSDAEGRYQLATVVPGLYPGRTRHIHVKVQAPSQPILTTQLFFPAEPANSSDSIFDPKLVVAEQDAPDGTKLAQFNFVLNVG